MAEETWGGGCVNWNSDIVEHTPDLQTPVPSDSQDVETIARAIANLTGSFAMLPGTLTDTCVSLRDSYGVRATVEHPGYISIPGDSHEGVPDVRWDCGTANNNRWEAQSTVQATGRVIDTRATMVPDTETNGFVIATALANAIGLEHV